MEAARQLNDAINQLPKKAPMDTLDAIKLLREVMLGEAGPSKTAAKQPQRVSATKPQRVATKQKPATNTVADMEVPGLQPQRVPNASIAEPVDNAQEPTYISDDKDDARPTPRGRSPRLNNSLDAERPDVPGNAPHRIVALVAKETAEMPRLSMQQNKLARGWSAANLELQLRE